MDLAQHFAAIWRHKWVVLLVSIVVAALTYQGVKLEAKTYQASAQLSVSTGQGQNGQGIEQVIPFVASTYATMATTRSVLSDAIRYSGLRISPSEAAKRVSAQNPGSLGFLTITTTGPSPSAAAALNRGVTRALTNAVATQQRQSVQAEVTPINNQINQISNQLDNLPAGAPQRTTLEAQYQALIQAVANDELQPTYGLTVVSPTQASGTPTSPQPKKDALLAFVTALVVLAEASAGYELLTDRFSGTPADDDIRRLVNLPVLARIPKVAGPQLVEAIRSLRTSLLFSNDHGKAPTRTIAIVSSTAQVGKSFTSILLASSFADLGVKTALVDADMRRPVLAQRLGIPPSPGLSEALRDENIAARLVRSTDNGQQLFILPAGASVADPAALLSSHLTSSLLFNSADLDVVVIDTPADSIFPDASIIAANCDATVIIIDAKSTKKRSLKVLVDHLRQVGAHPVGVAINRTSPAIGVRYRDQRDGYYQRFEEAEAVKAR
jgi:succinoglycan biosynthesis transport protein ExoP